MTDRIVSVAEIRDLEARTWAAGVAQADVIRRAGLAVAEVVRRLTRPGDPVLVLAGRGHNGDDALEAADGLADRAVTVVQLADDNPLTATRRWLSVRAGHPGARVIDGLFGIGLNRPLEGEPATLVEAVNASGVPVIAVDVPSGLDADTGIPGGSAIEAEVTVTLGAVKRGLLNDAAARFVGRIELARDIGLHLPDPEVGENEAGWIGERDFAGFPPQRPAGGHKGTFGHVAIVAGSDGYHGAAVLAAAGALRARPGLVTVFTQEACYVPVASQLRAAMVRPWRGEAVDLPGLSAIVVGPGLASPRISPACRSEVERLWRTARVPVIADASGLEWLPAEVADGAGFRVITPHPGEAARLLGTDVAEVQADRFGAVRRLAARYGGRSFVALKGRHTVTGGASGAFGVNSSGNSGLAQGGSGDVLAGYLGGLLAQPRIASDPVRAVRFGVWRHGAAADALAARGGAWTIDDLVAELGAGSEKGLPL